MYSLRLLSCAGHPSPAQATSREEKAESEDEEGTAVADIMSSSSTLTLAVSNPCKEKLPPAEETDTLPATWQPLYMRPCLHKEAAISNRRACYAFSALSLGYR